MFFIIYIIIYDTLIHTLLLLNIRHIFVLLY